MHQRTIAPLQAQARFHHEWSSRVPPTWDGDGKEGTYERVWDTASLSDDLVFVVGSEKAIVHLHINHAFPARAQATLPQPGRHRPVRTLERRWLDAPQRVNLCTIVCVAR